MPVEEAKVTSKSSVSSRIIAAGIVIAFCYWASTVLVTLLVAVLMAYFLDPVVTWMERARIPRALGALIVVLVTAGMLSVVAYSLVDRADQFGRDWPKYREPLRAASQAVETRMDALEKHVSEIEPAERPGEHVVTVGDTHTVRDALVGRLDSLYAFVLAATFVPFLLFFMLAAKRQVWHATMQLFAPGERTAVRDALADVTQVLRSYLLGTSLVGLILVLASWFLFWLFGLDFPFLTGLVSGICNLVPYLGVIMSWVPPLLVGLKQYHTIGPFVGDLRGADRLPYRHREPAGSRAGGLARAVKRARAHGFTPLLGLDVGSDGADSGDSHHRRTQSGLRPRGKFAACGPLAERLTRAAIRRCAAARLSS